MEGQSRRFRGVANVATKLFNAIEVRSFFFASPKLINKTCSPLVLVSDKRVFNGNFCCDDTAEIFLYIQSQRISTSYPPPVILLPDWYCHLVGHRSQRRHVKSCPPYIKRCSQNDVGRQYHESRISLERHRSWPGTHQSGLVNMRLDYIELNGAADFEDGACRLDAHDPRPLILSGALWVDKTKTRLIDHIILDDANGITSS